MNNVFAICGDSGSGKTTLSKYIISKMKNIMIFDCDRYHKWERGNWNWKYYTHLNPYANHINQMILDVEDLKNNKAISQIEYDHHTGKFTDKVLIEPCKNIIICGLHSFYIKANVKIFIDIEKNLKYLWKINRDFKERKYSIDDIIKNIKKREIEYNNYIYPQINQADIIISYYWDNELKTKINIINHNNDELERIICELQTN